MASKIIEIDGDDPMLKPREPEKPKIDLSDDNFGCVLNCAVRYALGRQSYMPFIVVEFITPLLPFLNDRTIWCFERDLESDLWSYGNSPTDEPVWRQFQTAVKVETERREKHEGIPQD